MTAETKPTPDAIRFQLKRILASPAFRGTPKQRDFLQFVVDEALQGRASQLKGYTIAVSVYGRAQDFDPQVDPIVRVEAGRLRRALDHYYLSAGRNDPVRIAIPKGAYVPDFDSVGPAEAVGQPDRRQNPRRAKLARPSIAVLPLTNLTGQAKQDFFVDGLTEELTSELARYQDFRVLAAQSCMRFKRQADPLVIGKELRVRFLVTGSVRRDADTVKVTVQLVDTASGAQIWSQNFMRKLNPGSIIDIQEKIALNVAGTLGDQYGLISRHLSMESRKKAPRDMKAYDAVLRFYQYETELTPEAFKRALKALALAVDIEPSYGLAWSMLGHLHADNHALGFCEIEAPLDKALAFAQRGLALGPQNQFAADALSLVYFHKGDKQAFLQHVERTLALNPNAPYFIGVAGWHLTLFGEWERGRALMQKGMALNPYYPSWFHLATFLNAYRAGDYEQALAEAVRFNFPGLYFDPMMRAAALIRMGKSRQAKLAINDLLALVPDFIQKGRQLIGKYVKVEELVEALIDDLVKAGLNSAV